MTQYELVSGLLSVETSQTTLPWGLGRIGPWNQLPGSTQQTDLLIRYDVEPGLVPGDSIVGGRRMHYWSLSDDGVLHYRRSAGGPLEFQMDIAIDHESGIVHLRVNKLLNKYVKVRLNNLHSPGYVITDLMLQLLAMRGWAPMHCSAVTRPSSDQVTVLLAPPNTGKTLTALTLVKEFGYGYVCEDLALYRDGEMRGFTWTSTFRYYPTLVRNRWQRLRMQANAAIPPLELLKVRNDVTTLDVVPSERIRGRGTVDRTFLLTLGERQSGPDPVARDLAFRWVRTLNRYEFKYETAPAVVALETLGTAVDVESAYNNVRHQVEQLVSTKQILRLECPQSTAFARLIAGEEEG